MYDSNISLKQEKFWDEQYAQDSNLWGDCPSKCLELTLSHLLRNNSKKVLDVGCGYGRDVFYLQKRGMDCCGVDISDRGIEIAKKRVREDCSPRFLLLDTITLPFSNGCMDAIISSRMLHLLDESQQEIFVKEIKRVLRPGGIIGVTVRTIGDPSLLGAKITDRGWELPFRQGHIVNPMSSEDLKRLFQNHFRVLKIEELEEIERIGDSCKVRLAYILCEKPD